MLMLYYSHVRKLFKNDELVVNKMESRGETMVVSLLLFLAPPLFFSPPRRSCFSSEEEQQKQHQNFEIYIFHQMGLSLLA